MIFLDTSAIYALADRDDAYHNDAVRLFQAALEQGEEFIMHNYILAESSALLQRRLSHQVALQFLEDAGAFRVIWIDDALHGAAIRRFSDANTSGVSFVDSVSFHVMTDLHIRLFLGFDQHFVKEGFASFTG